MAGTSATGDSKPTVRFPNEDPGFSRTSGPDALSCVACHNQPVIGGAGDFSANVFVGAHFADPPTKSIDTQVTSERNTTNLLGSGLVELLAREMTEDLLSIRNAAAEEAGARPYSKRPDEVKNRRSGNRSARRRVERRAGGDGRYWPHLC